MTRFTTDLAVSAVSFDAALVAELFTELRLRLRSEPLWDGDAAREGHAFHASLVAERSRIALVLHQRLWQHDPATADDAVLLRARLRDRPESVCVMTLDDSPIPDWLADAPRCDLATVGVRGAAAFAFELIEARGGTLEPPALPAEPALTRNLWGEGGTPFLAQPRAQSALRHQLDAMGATLARELERRRADQPESTCEIHVLPHRLIARVDDMALSFSWVGGRAPTVAEGRLLAMQWTGVATETRGVAALRSATPVRERVYRPDGTNAEHWQWRTDEQNGQAYSTANLVAEWFASTAFHQPA